MWETIIPAAGSLLGGFLGRESVEDQQAANLANQREFAQHGIQWRVADAKAAGLHPLFALSGGGAAYAPAPIIVDPMAEAIRSLGQSVGNYFRPQAGGQQDGRRLPPSSGSSSWDPYAAEDAAMGEDYGYSGSGIARVSDPDFGWDAWRYEQPKVQSARTGNPAVEAGPARPGLVEYQLSPNFAMLFPAGTSFSEAVESLENPLMWPALLKLNADQYGSGFYQRFADAMVPGYKVATDGIANLIKRGYEYYQSKRGGPVGTGRNRVTGKIRGAEPRGPSQVPGYQGSWE